MSETHVDERIWERYNALVADIAKASWDDIDALAADARAFGEDSPELGVALGAAGRMARWTQERLESGRDGLERAETIAAATGLAVSLRARWLNWLAVVCDDIGDAAAAVSAADRSLARTLEAGPEIPQETLAGRQALVHTLRLASEPVGPALRALVPWWPRLAVSEREVQRDCIHRFARRRNDLDSAQRTLLEQVTAEPASLDRLAPPPPPSADPEALAAVLADLDSLVGLEEVKAEVRRLAAVLQVNEMRRAAGMDVPDTANHLAFLGPPGTGKTTVARLLGRLFKALGILATDSVVEVDRSALVAGYIGQTAIRVDEAVDRALDGVLFVDEAYALAPQSGNDFGHEAIATLLKRMEDDRHRLVVVLAGYDEPMRELLRANPGFESRVATTLRFRSYGEHELGAIFAAEAARGGFELAPGVTERVREICELMCGSEDPETFGNAREVRNLFEDAVGAQAERIVAAIAQGGAADAQALRELRAEDVHWAELGVEALEAAMTDEERRRVAYHEIGHALVGHVCGGPPPLLVTVIPSARAAGRTFFALDRRSVLTRTEIVAIAARALGGRAAEQLAFGSPSSGATDDLERAERVALGLLRAGLSEESPGEALAEFAATRGDGSGWRGERARQEIAELLQEAYALAERALAEHEEPLHRAAAALSERRTLRAVELVELFGHGS